MIVSKSPKMARGDELFPVSGNESIFPASATSGATVVVVGVVVVAAAPGVPVIAFDATESPIVFTALMVTE